MGKVIWSPTAYKDIDLIAEYIARDSVDRAALFVTKLMEQVDAVLVSYPNSGRKIPEMNDESWRELIYGPYRIMYRIKENDDVFVAGVIHGARDWKP
ncbi:MAG: type II toxin-antitoxin system RelE/ParE family toxin [Calditrichaceae bacterium]|nr:type II toxin-antitoxin system RelE/ParE family toxin [Calditrichaceae bacterium]